MSNSQQKIQNEGSIGLVQCVTIIVGGMIGSAIFSLSGMTIYEAGPAALISWVIAAIILLMYGLQIAELSTIFPKSGGVFVFPSKALGDTEKKGKIWGWISFWGYLNANLAGIGFAAIYVSTYLGVGFPVFSGLQIPMAIAAVAFCFLLNILKFTVTGNASTVMVVGLVTTMVIFIAVGLFGGSWEPAQFTPFLTQGAMGSTGFMSAVPTAMVAYGSIVAIAFMVSEVKNPNRNVPKSILIAMSIVVVLYLLILLTTLGLVTADFLVENPGMRFIPLYAAAFTKLAAFPWIAKLISIAAVLALLTTILVLVALTSRAIAAVAAGFISCFPQFTSQIVNLGAMFAAITISINCVSLYVARQKNTYIPGNFRAPGGKFLPLITIAIIIIAYIPGIIKGSAFWYYGLIWYGLGALILLVSLKRSAKSNDKLKVG